MSLSSAIIDAMVAAGASVEVLAAAMKADLAEREDRVEIKRQKDAERQRRHRASRDVTVTECDSVTNPTPSLSPQTPQTHPHPSNNKPARVKGHRLPNDWQPSALPAELTAAVAFWPLKALERELSRFRDWAASATGPNAIKLDWQAAWRNWVRKAEDEGRYGRNIAKSSGGQGGTDLVSSILGKQHAASP